MFPNKELVSEDEARHTVELQGMFVVKPAHPWWFDENWKNGKLLSDGFRYGSDNNPEWLSAKGLNALIIPKFSPCPVPPPVRATYTRDVMLLLPPKQSATKDIPDLWPVYRQNA